VGLRDACGTLGAKLVLIYVPDKAHVVLPAAGDALPAEGLAALARLGAPKAVPDAQTFLGYVLSNADGRESAVTDMCRREGIALFSLTKTMQESVRNGVQVYYTYDQHWTPRGHDAAARALADYLSHTPSFASTSTRL
jgi:hypothetical protein